MDSKFQIPYLFKQIWDLREECIAAIKQLTE